MYTKVTFFADMPFYKIAKDSLLERVPILQNADDPELSAALKRMAIIIQNDTIFKGCSFIKSLNSSIYKYYL